MTAPRVLVLLSADYELFLGRNFHPPEEVLFGPAAELLAACRACEVPLTLFPDVCSVWAHRRWGADAYAERFEAQLVEAAQAGHDVQLHLHPHWLWAEPAGGERGTEEATEAGGAIEWRIAADRLNLADCGFGIDEDGAPAIVRRGVEYLERLLRPHRAGYRCVAFRAGALALGPREGELIAALLAAGIRVDSSVVKGVVARSDAAVLDYAGAPAAANWWMAAETGVAVPAPAGLWEVPIATFRCPPAARVGFLARRAAAVRRMRGTGISRAARQTRWANLRTLVAGNLRYLGGDPWFVLSADTKGMTAKMLADGFDAYVRRHRGAGGDGDGPIVVSMINHPKLMGGREIELFAGFVEGVRRRHGDDVAFTTFTSVVDEIVERAREDGP